MARAVLVVLDSAGIGAAADADRFGGGGADTLRHVPASARPSLPHLEAMGLRALVGHASDRRPAGWAARVCPRSAGKDPMAGHWETMGVVIDQPLRT